MEQTIIFNDIRSTILSEISSAEREILIAVAWITDTEILHSLAAKINSGVDITIVVMDDNFNRDFFLINDLIPRDKIIFNKRCHHKYCIIDDTIAISGSYNWTFSANNRNNGENICVFSDETAIYEFKNNFYNLIGKEVEELSITDYYIEKFIEMDYGEIVGKNDISWWLNLNDEWKEIFFENIRAELDDINLIEFEKNNYHNLMYNYHSELNLDLIEKLCLNPLIIYILHLTHISEIKLFTDNWNFQPLSKLRFLRSIENLSLLGDTTFSDSDNSIINKLKIKNFTSTIILPWEKLRFDLMECITIELCVSEISENHLNFIPITIKELYLSGSNSNMLNLDLRWFRRYKNLQYLKLDYLDVDYDKISIPKIELNWCILWNLWNGNKLPENFIMSNSHIMEY